MKHCLTRLLALLLAALLLGTASLAEAGIDIAVVDAPIGQTPEIELPELPDGVALGDLDLAIGPEAAAPRAEANAATPVKLGVGQKYAINTKKLGKSLSFKSSKPKVATVSKKGVVTAKAKGTAVITCLSGKKKAGTWKVTVKPAPKKVSLNAKALTVGKGEQVRLAATTTKGSLTTLKWKSSKKSCVTVDADGLVKGKRPGEATVTVTTHNGLKASVTVTVKNAPKKLTLSAAALELKPGASKTLKAALPAGTASHAMTWASNNESVAKVTDKGKVKAVANGTATITATAFNGVSASCEVEVAESFSTPIDEAHFPDKQFRAVVSGFDADKDGLLSRSEANAVKKIEIWNDYELESLKGIEYFKALEVLYCISGSLEDVDVSQNTALRILDLSDTCVKALDVTHNTELRKLIIEVTWQLDVKLDVSKCRKLEVLACAESSLKAVEIGGLPELKTADFLWCDGITKLDVSGCAKLKELTVPGGDDFGYLDYLNIDGCVSLEKMHCVNNKLKTLNVSHCPGLVECLQAGPADEGEGWIRYEHGENYLTVDKDIALTPAPKA